MSIFISEEAENKWAEGKEAEERNLSNRIWAALSSPNIKNKGLQVATCETRMAQPLVPFPEKQGATVSFHALFAQHIQGQASTCAQL